MKTVGVTMVRDEDDIVARTVAHMLNQVDAVLVADNMSRDDTRVKLDGLAAAFPDRLVVIDDLEPGYRQSEKMTALALRARLQLHADWIVPFDADEWWYSTFYGRISDALLDIPERFDIVPAELFDHVVTSQDEPTEADPISRIGWRRKAAVPLPKVAVRWRPNLVIEQGNHKAHYEGDVWKHWYGTAFVIRHFPYRSHEQFVRKVRNGSEAYRAAGDAVPAGYGLHWRQWGDLLEQQGEAALTAIFDEWYSSSDPIGDELIFDPAP